MLGRLIALFVIVPLVDLAILIRLGQALGFWPTLALVVATGTAGALLARSQGMSVVRGIRAELSAGRMPSDRLLDGVLVLIGATLLLTPGLVTDLAGFLLLLPPSRARLSALLKRRAERMIRAGASGFPFLRR